MPPPLIVKVIAAIIIEIVYAVFTRTWLREHAQGIALELFITAFRIFTATVYWIMFRDLIFSRIPQSGSLKHPLLFATAVTALALPFLFRGWSPGGGIGTAIIFALTSIIVAVREELLYRAVLLNLLEPRIGMAGSVIFSTFLFVVYHYGALPITMVTITEVAIMSMLLGLIYMRSGSLLGVIALHSAYDGIWFFGPYLDSPLPDTWRLVFLLGALLFVFSWLWRVSKVQ